MSEQTERAARLSALRAAVAAWAEYKRGKIEEHLVSAKKLRQARGELTESAALAAEVLVAEEISEFIE